MKPRLSWKYALIGLAAAQIISAQPSGMNSKAENMPRPDLAGRAITGPGIIPIGSSLTFGGTNAPDTYSAMTTFSSTPVVVDNGAVKIWQEQVPTASNAEWDIFYMETTSGGPLAGNINANWNIVMNYTLSAAVVFDALFSNGA